MKILVSGATGWSSAAPSSDKLGQMSKISWRQVLALALAAFFVVGSLSNIFAPAIDLRGISSLGIPALVPFRDRIAGTHDRRFAGARTDAAMGLGARLHRDVGGAGDRDTPRQIRARGGAAYRGGAIDTRRLDRLAEAAFQLGMTKVRAPDCAGART